MTRNGLAKVFDFECTFEARGEEAAEGRNEGGECCKDEDVKLHRGDVNGGRDLKKGWKREVGEKVGYVVGLVYKNGVWVTGEACENVGPKVLKHD